MNTSTANAADPERPKMSEFPTKVHLLGISGSLRRGSFSSAILQTLAEDSRNVAEITIFHIGGVPLYNGDLEDEGLPDSVRKLKDAIAAADGVVIVTPEYNYGMSGVLKNTLDWASRPGYQSVLKNKPVLMIASSPSFTGGVRALGQLRQTLAATLSRVVATPEIVIAQAHEKIKDERLTDETSLKFARDGIEALATEIRLTKQQ